MSAPTEHKDVLRRRESLRKRRIATLAKIAIGAAGLAAFGAWLVLLAR